MKKIFTALISAIFVIGATTAMAGGNKYKHSGWHGHHKQHYSYRHRGHNSHNGAYLVGGLILGSIIANNYHRSHQSYRVVHHSTYHEPVSRRQVIYRTRVVEPEAETAATGRQLLRDLEGNCFEIHRSDEGDELKEQLPEEACHW